MMDIVRYVILLCVLLFTATIMEERINSLIAITIIIGYLALISLHEVRVLLNTIISNSKKELQEKNTHSNVATDAIIEAIQKQNQHLETIAYHMDYQSKGIKSISDNTKYNRQEKLVGSQTEKQ